MPSVHLIPYSAFSVVTNRFNEVLNKENHRNRHAGGGCRGQKAKSRHWKKWRLRRRWFRKAAQVARLERNGISALRLSRVSRRQFNFDDHGFSSVGEISANSPICKGTDGTKKKILPR
jgi:hypothetical protein